MKHEKFKLVRVVVEEGDFAEANAFLSTDITPRSISVAFGYPSDTLIIGYEEGASAFSYQLIYREEVFEATVLTEEIEAWLESVALSLGGVVCQDVEPDGHCKVRVLFLVQTE